MVIPNADFSTASNRHTFSEEGLFHSYCVYFYAVTGIGQRTITLQYAGRVEPLDTHPAAEFTTLLHLDQLPRDSITFPLDLDGNWVIATTRGAKLVQVLFPGTANDSSSNGRSGGGGSSSSSSSGSKGSSSSSNSISSRGGSSNRSSSGSGSSSSGSGRSSSTGRGTQRSGNCTVTFNDNLIMAAGVDGVAELPFLGTPIPPLTAALDTIYWQATVEIWPSCVQY